MALRDSAESTGSSPRVPIRTEFFPVGHVSLDRDHGKYRHLGLPETGVYWVRNLYVILELRGTGLGKTVMRMLETMAVQDPLNASIMALDTVAKELQEMESMMEWYTEHGQPPPKVRSKCQTKMVDLATPNNGTHIANMLLSSCRFPARCGTGGKDTRCSTKRVRAIGRRLGEIWWYFPESS